MSLVSQLDGSFHLKYLAYEWVIVQAVTWHCQMFWIIFLLFVTSQLSSVFDFMSAKLKISSRTAAGGRRWSIAAPQAAQASYPSAALALLSTWATGTQRRRRGSIPAQVHSPQNFVTPFAYFTCEKGPY